MNALADDLVDFQMNFDYEDDESARQIRELFVKEVENKRRPGVFSYAGKLNTSQTDISDVSPKEIRRNLVKGVISCIYKDSSSYSIHGDILSFSPLGKQSIACGITGLLGIEDQTLKDLQNQIAKYLNDFLFQQVIKIKHGEKEAFQSGYLHGLSGVSLFCDEDIVSEFCKILSGAETIHSSGATDISLRTGLAGDVLCLCSLANKGLKVEEILAEKALKLAEAVSDKENKLVSVYSISEKPAGLIDGKLGAGVALAVASAILNDSVLAVSAIEALKSDLDNVVDAGDGSVQILDRTRYLPYLAEGSAGFLLASLLVPHFSDYIFERYSKEKYEQAVNVRICVNGGILLGRAGLVAAQYYGKTQTYSNDSLSRAIKDLFPYLFQVNDGGSALISAGHSPVKLSADYSTGNIGLLKLLDCIADNKSAWFLFPGLENLEKIKF